MFRAKRNNPYAQVEGQREAMKGANARAGAQQATTPAPNGTGTAAPEQQEQGTQPRSAAQSGNVPRTPWEQDAGGAEQNAGGVVQNGQGPMAPGSIVQTPSWGTQEQNGAESAEKKPETMDEWKARVMRHITPKNQDEAPGTAGSRTSNEEFIEDVSGAALSKEEQARRERAAGAVAGIGNLGDLLSAFSNLVFTTKGAANQPAAKAPSAGDAIDKERTYWDKVRQQYLTTKLANERLKVQKQAQDISEKRQAALEDYYRAQADRWKANKEHQDFIDNLKADVARWKHEHDQGKLDIEKERTAIRKKEADTKAALAAHKISNEDAKQRLEELKEQNKQLDEIVTTTKDKKDPVTGETITETTTREKRKKGGGLKAVDGFGAKSEKKKVEGFSRRV